MLSLCNSVNLRQFFHYRVITQNFFISKNNHLKLQRQSIWFLLTSIIIICWLCNMAAVVSSLSTLFNAISSFLSNWSELIWFRSWLLVSKSNYSTSPKPGERNGASYFWNYEVPVLDQIGSGDGWSRTWAI